jgi:hypothetical protein
MPTTCPFHLILLDLIVLISYEGHKLWNSSLCNFLRPAVTSPLLGPNVLFLFSVCVILLTRETTVECIFICLSTLWANEYIFPPPLSIVWYRADRIGAQSLYSVWPGCPQSVQCSAVVPVRTALKSCSVSGVCSYSVAVYALNVFN